MDLNGLELARLHLNGLGVLHSAPRALMKARDNGGCNVCVRLCLFTFVCFCFPSFIFVFRCKEW